MSETEHTIKRFESEARQPEREAITDTEPSAPPVYEKPVIRKYDQIDQVKPYGPSELEAG
jgi:hypothetical protein